MRDALIQIVDAAVADAYLRGIERRLDDFKGETKDRLGRIEARRDADVDVHRLVVFATPERYDALAPLLEGEGYAVEPVRIGEFEAPPWSLAFALATWAAPSRSAA